MNGAENRYWSLNERLSFFPASSCHTRSNEELVGESHEFCIYDKNEFEYVLVRCTIDGKQFWLVSKIVSLVTNCSRNQYKQKILQRALITVISSVLIISCTRIYYSLLINSSPRIHICVLDMHTVQVRMRVLARCTRTYAGVLNL